MGARDFVQRLLLDGLGVRYLLVGDDFRFGHGRTGDYEMLRAMGAEARWRRGVPGGEPANHRPWGRAISSTRVREALLRGDLEAARAPAWATLPDAGPGRTRRQARAHHRLPNGQHRPASAGEPPARRFAVQVYGLAAAPLPGVANIGTRPTVDGGDLPALEVHPFDFDRDIYGRSCGGGVPAKAPRGAALRILRRATPTDRPGCNGRTRLFGEPSGGLRGLSPSGNAQTAVSEARPA